MDGERPANTRITVRPIRGRYSIRQSVPTFRGCHWQVVSTADRCVNRLIASGAGDAIGIWLGIGMGDHPPGRAPDLLTLHMALLSRLKRPCSRLTDPRRPAPQDLIYGKALKSAPTHT
jgi:hypothetical protein